MWNAHRSEHGLLPETCAAFDGCESIHGDEDQDSFHRTRNQTKSQGMGMVLLPSLDIESKKSCGRSQLLKTSDSRV